uniref:ATP synthase F(1) complex subunit delta, mitochondrial n=1 Tax=Daphnia similis TaxID=35528 RepID=A0A4Y7LUY9_9CRUS|nr:EOG090X0JDB [Daphnia similis]SVE71441.1 EOG090X0JDB [Daphnia similis]SVE72074.1 EOG090X0JDB [Daphnia similis]SVE72701.1 EOG090X0JDB [Daphnia similis]
MERMALTRSALRLFSGRFTQACQVRGYADAPSMSLTFAAPSQVLYNNISVKQVDVPSFSGSFGILPAHVPTLAVLKPGVVTVFENDGSTKKFFVSSGTVTINEDSTVQLLAEEAVPVDTLDISAAKELLAQSQSQLASASSEVAKAEAEISIEVSEALVKACE